MGGAAPRGVGVVAGLERGGGAAERGHRMTAPRIAEQRVRGHARARPAASGHLEFARTGRKIEYQDEEARESSKGN